MLAVLRAPAPKLRRETANEGPAALFAAILKSSTRGCKKQKYLTPDLLQNWLCMVQQKIVVNS